MKGADKTWRDRLKTANWRGTDFLTDNHDAKEGRRLVVTEFPGRDTVEVEDLGAKAQNWRVNAYFLGPNYDLDRDTLLTLLRIPGPGWLMHPWLGHVWARAQDWTITETNAEGGIARVSIEFVPGGSGETPKPEIDVADAADESVRAYGDAASDYEPPALPANAAAALIARLQNSMNGVRNALARARMPLTVLSAVLSTVDDAKALLAEAVALPGTYAKALRSIGVALGGVSGAVGAAGGLADSARVRTVAALTREATAAMGPLTAATLGAADSRALRHALLAEQTARGHWLVATAMQVALADYTTAEARDTALGLVINALEALLPTADDAVFEAACAARLGVQRALTLQALEPTQTRQIVAPLPGAVLAYRLEMDEAALLERNAVRHPLFVQGAIHG